MRLIDADDLRLFLCRLGRILKCEENHSRVCKLVGKVIDYIDAMPTVDAVPVVRCKDCKYSDAKRLNRVEKCFRKNVIFCRNCEMCGDETLAMLPDDYCSCGERKMDLEE